MDTRLVTIDSSSKKSGLAYFENGVYKEHYLIDCSKEKDMETRFEEMSKKLWLTLYKYNPDIVYIEETVVLRNAQTQRFLTRLQGVVYAWCMIYNCEFNTIRPTSWRSAIGMKQGRNVKRDQLKEQSVKYVLDKYGLDVGDDESDAICIGDAVLRIYGDSNV